MRHVCDAQTAQILGAVREQVDTVKFDAAARDAAAVAAVTHRGQPDGGFASAGFTNQAEHLAHFEIQIDTMHNLDPVVTGIALHAQVADGQKYLAHRSLPSILQPGGAVQHPVNDKIHPDCQPGDGCSGQERCEVPERYQGGIVTHH